MKQEIFFHQERIYNCPTYCVSWLYADGKHVCEIIEDTDRGLDQSMPLSEIRKRKVRKLTAIPTGTYEITMNVQSPKFSKMKAYKEFCDGYMPRFLNVPGFDGILIHPGTSALSTDGCVIPGRNSVKGKVVKSAAIWRMLMKEYFIPARMLGQKITYTISRKYQV